MTTLDSLQINNILSSNQQFNNYSSNITIFSLPEEIIEKIIEYSYYLEAPNYTNEDTVANRPDDLKIRISSSSKNLIKNNFNGANLNNLMYVNSKFYFLCLKYKYLNCKFIRSFNFIKFLKTLLNYRNVGEFVRVLDFMEFTSIGLGKSFESINKIQNLTNITFFECLRLCPNLETLLLSESLDYDINLDILNFIFNELSQLKNLDFCGFSNMEIFNDFEMNLNRESQIENLSFHECLNLTDFEILKILPYLPNLKRLDLSHTKITISCLQKVLEKNTNITHLSLKKCSHLGTITDFIKFLKSDILNENLRWLNLQNCFSSDSFTAERLDLLIEILSKCPDLRYLNLNGFANLNMNHLTKIVNQFKNLKSLSISDLDMDLQRSEDEFLQLLKLSELKYLEFLDLSNLIYNYRNLLLVLQILSVNIQVLEIKPKIVDLLPATQFQFNDSTWRIYENKVTSRRCWIHKVKSIVDCKYYDNFESRANNKIEWDLNTGELIIDVFKRVNFIGMACNKIDVLNTDLDWGNDSTVRGIYKYYAMKA